MGQRFFGTVALIMACVLIAISFWRQAAEPELGSYVYLIVGFGGLGLMLYLALSLQSRDPHHFNIVVASETIVVYGIANLIVGLVSAVGMVYAGGYFANGGFDTELIPLLSQPFLEGLLIAGIAPLGAAILRNLAVEPEEEMGIDLDGLRKASDGLAKSMKKAGVQVEALSAVTERGSVNLESSIRRAVSAASSFADDFNSNFGGLERTVDKLATNVSALVSNLEASTETLKGVSGNFDNLKQKTREATEMLETLSTVIERVEKFTVRDRSGS